MAADTAAALAAASSAADALASATGDGVDFRDPALRLEIMAAKIRAASAAQKSVAIAHQLHGAIGITAEHVLHLLTLRALAWRDDYGTKMEWTQRLGRLVCDEGAAGLWPRLAAR